MTNLEPANSLLGDGAALRKRAAADGVLLLRDFVSRDALARVRAAVLGICAEAGWTAPGADPMAGAAAPGQAHRPGEPAFMRVYRRIQACEAFHALAHRPELLAVFGRLLGEPIVPHARNIARVVFPNFEAWTTPAHQGHIHIGGTEETWTTWIPLGDCPRTLGSLAVMPGSHRAGVLPTQVAYGPGGKGVEARALPFDWAEPEYAAGDLLAFHSLTVHRALPNLSGRLLRLSVDFRYQAVSRPVARASFEPHHGGAAWDELYSGWQSANLQHYWRDLPLRFAD